ncbi:TIGR02281 family clan AA aspartic protease [Nodosilinea sp. PGN35]|uniref:retropepsin-like aspartic protease family protein n=1 Tax=Nodosilinea sp. PGN35 TaxID=3020489 RepID=UPI0023B26A22|nr:retropepsin-like aspartic protease [Nodosilinea sp. TSF1-S3]MDF0365379.1 retropepsin-like aspartic protease [Nodosilinea sp. TSF1-S3]
MERAWAIANRLVLATMALGLTGCDLLASTIVPGIPNEEAVGTPQAIAREPIALPVAAEPAPVPPPASDTFREAVNRATSAVAIGQSAQSSADWQLAASRWQQAVALMEQVPSSSPNRAQAQTKAQEYKQHLAAAQRRATNGIVPAPAPVAAAPAIPAGLAAQIPIQRRQGGTPVVDVTLQASGGTQTFPMLFDTGATGTLITAEMAQAVGVTVVGETQARIADGSVVTLPIGLVNAVELGGLRREQVTVAIGGSYGLLGQDIYGQYGIAIGSHMIHLHQ